MASSLYATTSSDSGSGRVAEHDGAGTETLTQKPPGHREPERDEPRQTRFGAERLAHSQLGGRLTIWSSMLLETPLKYESRRFQPEAWSGPPLLSRHSCAFAKRSGRRPWQSDASVRRRTSTSSCRPYHDDSRRVVAACRAMAGARGVPLGELGGPPLWVSRFLAGCLFRWS